MIYAKIHNTVYPHWNCSQQLNKRYCKEKESTADWILSVIAEMMMITNPPQFTLTIGPVWLLGDMLRSYCSGVLKRIKRVGKCLFGMTEHHYPIAVTCLWGMGYVLEVFLLVIFCLDCAFNGIFFEDYLLWSFPSLYKSTTLKICIGVNSFSSLGMYCV